MKHYVTKQYQAVLQCVQSRGADAFTAAELTEDLRHTGHPVGLATVYRQLEKLEAAGMVHKVPTEEGALEVNVLPSYDRWFGMTYRQDRETVAEELRQLHAQGVYPGKLWN